MNILLALVLLQAELISTFTAPEARQGVAVDDTSFYAIDSRAIARYDKRTGERTGQWEGRPGGPIIHLDSGVVVDGRLYCAHSNYPGSPMRSSIEIWDAATLTHAGRHDFGVRWGSLTWLDRHDGYWWATFANYDQIVDGKRYGGKDNTVLLKLDGDWEKVQSWTFPPALLARFGEMSNSGGSWGPDGRLYLTGHDAAEVYVVKLPPSASTLELVETIPAAIAGQGIAWDRNRPGMLYGIVRAKRQVTVSRLIPSP